MISNILSYMRCPRCKGSPLVERQGGIFCAVCHQLYSFESGILDMIGDSSDEMITPFQRLMQTHLIVSIYEKIWRRIGYFIASSRSFSKEMQTVLHLGAGKRRGFVLDLACGTGIFTRPLSRSSEGIVVGLDLSRPMLKQASRMILKSSIDNIVLIRASVFSMPFNDNVFKYINCCGALHLFDDPCSALTEIKRILSPQGYLSVQTTIKPTHSAGMASFLDRYIRFGFFNENGLIKILKDQDFNIIESRRHRISFTFLAQKVG
jgi:ubiquinone/menaquinone biosynthesis C-methylase UbiE